MLLSAGLRAWGSERRELSLHYLLPPSAQRLRPQRAFLTQDTLPDVWLCTCSNPRGDPSLPTVVMVSPLPPLRPQHKISTPGIYSPEIASLQFCFQITKQKVISFNFQCFLRSGLCGLIFIWHMFVLMPTMVSGRLYSGAGDNKDKNPCFFGVHISVWGTGSK